MKDCYVKSKDNVYKLEDFSSRLKLLKQNSLYENDAPYSIYRFLWMASFDTLTSITFHMKQDEQWVEWSRGFFEEDGTFNDSKNEKKFKIISGKSKLYDLDSLSMKRIITDLGFWKDHPMGPCNSRMGFLDGSEWLFEVHEGKKYKCVSRSNPGSGSKYYLLGILFFKAARIEKKLEEIY